MTLVSSHFVDVQHAISKLLCGESISIRVVATLQSSEPNSRCGAARCDSHFSLFSASVVAREHSIKIGKWNRIC
jgi:hypothetical protein